MHRQPYGWAKQDPKPHKKVPYPKRLKRWTAKVDASLDKALGKEKRTKIGFTNW